MITVEVTPEQSKAAWDAIEDTLPVHWQTINVLVSRALFDDTIPDDYKKQCEELLEISERVCQALCIPSWEEYMRKHSDQ